MRLATVIGVIAVALLAVASAAAWPPQQYRFTGWMSAGVGYAPYHAFSEGDAVVLHFQDAGNDKPTSYRVCWSHINGTNRKCWTKVARSFRISSITTGGPLLHFGSYIARWYVGGRVVATWPFLFDREIINHP